jgi:hypothetical protein
MGVNEVGRAGASSTESAESRCPVCGNGLDPGEGMTAEWQGQVLRFRCLGCLARFEADPVRYLAGHTDPCGVDEEWDEMSRATTYVRAVAAWHSIANGSSPPSHRATPRSASR